MSSLGTLTLKLSPEQCIGCGRCEEVCPHAVFSVTDGKAEIQQPVACMECGACQRNCPAAAIRVETGVGCAAAMIRGALTGKEPSCGCDEGSGKSGCGCG